MQEKNPVSFSRDCKCETLNRAHSGPAALARRGNHRFMAGDTEVSSPSFLHPVDEELLNQDSWSVWCGPSPSLVSARLPPKGGAPRNREVPARSFRVQDRLFLRR